MPLTILSDSDVRGLLHSLSKEDILDLQQSLADALHHYSTSTEEDSNGCCSSYQPLRTSLKRSDGQTTLFMPASSNDGLGVKIVTLAVPDARTPDGSSLKSFDSLSLSQSQSQSSSSSSPSAVETPPPASSIASNSNNSPSSTTPKGSLTLLDKDGAPRALLNAEELTAFRTALASTMLFKKRTNVHDVVVFGAGKQAYWHTRLALLLRGPDIHHLNIINRSFDSAAALVQRLYRPFAAPAQFPDLDVHSPDDSEASGLARPKITILTPQHGEYARLLKATVRASSAIFCTTPSLTPLFPGSYLTNTEGRRKGRYVCAVGSYKPHMLELDPAVLKQNVTPEHGNHHHKHARQGGAVVVDSVEACLREAGEVVQAGLTGDEVVELGELVMLKREAERRRRDGEEGKEEAQGLDGRGVELRVEGGKKTTKKKEKKGDMEKEGRDEVHEGLTEWLQRGNVIYKSVGLGLMDVVVGGELVRLADERGVGTRIENF
ncbi:hypothetical protein BDV95DRAFT_503854 [Massariosphaeria phaeospora]|uniref:NAD(P)-binding protein n=1 Tax=Massariosphaeria phaeospora TaxID=100035 RepID=A0A7C8I775_9PLEO|nr:hypothetical protein BDV95DRAFT_503854 [Massariosphaeria phaeospora]